MIISDGAVNVDLTNTTCDYVTSLPSSYVSASMIRGLNTGNYTAYCLPLSGGTVTGKLQVNAPIIGYNYTNTNNGAAFMLDKPGSNWTGIGSNG
jgi:hypothetical protein